MHATRHLIVNADDFGLSPGVNAGIVQCHERGIVTSTSLMVRSPAAREAAEEARAHPQLSVGLHLDLSEWDYRGGEWVCRYAVVPADDPAAVAAEIDRQLDVFRSLLGHDPTHLDSHQHVHRAEPVRSLLQARANRLGVVLRDGASRVRYCGDFYGQSGRGDAFPEGITVEALLQILRALPPGVTELGCHPGLGDDADSVYRTERSTECSTLCDARLRAVLLEEGIALTAFSPALAQQAE